MTDPQLLAFNYVNHARRYATTECYKDAFYLYLKAVDQNLNLRKVIEFEFRLVLMKYNENLIIENNRAEVLRNFELSMKAFPGDVHLLTTIGKYLYKHSYFCEALCHFEKALQINSSLVTVEKNLNTVKKIIFPRAVYRVLNDRRASCAYVQAIHSIVLPNAECVLDLDTGTGVSAMYAYAYGSLSITACDASRNMANVAERIVTDNKMKDIVVVKKEQRYLNLNDVYGQRTLLIANKLDPGLIGNDFLLNLKHAWENLLSEYGRVIPGKAEYYVVGVKCDTIQRKYQVSPAAKKLLNVSDLNVHTETYSNESYYGEDVATCGNIEYMTDPQMVLKINFQDYYDVKDILKTKKPFNVNITAKKDGEINVIIGWFKLYLTDTITLTTDPQSKLRTEAWQQAAFLDFIPRKVKADDIINLQYLTSGGRLRLLSTMRRGGITRLSAPAIAFLNDTECVDTIVGSIPTATVYLTQIEEISEIEIADMSPFPLFGLLMMKRGAKSLICYARHINDKVFFTHVFRANNIPLTNITILVEDQWNHSVFKKQTYHAIFCNALDLSGDVDVRLSRVAQHLRCGHLVAGGLFMPACIALVGQLISSEWLDRNNMVNEVDKTFKVAAQANLFRTSQVSCIDVSRLIYTPLSDPALMASRCPSLRSKVIELPIKVDGVCNAILCWYEVQLLDNDEEIAMDRSHSFVKSTAFMVNPAAKVQRGDVVNIVRCVDADGAYKLVLDSWTSKLMKTQ